jgi:hypothetical protein
VITTVSSDSPSHISLSSEELALPLDGSLNGGVTTRVEWIAYSSLLEQLSTRFSTEQIAEVSRALQKCKRKKKRKR